MSGIAIDISSLLNDGTIIEPCMYQYYKNLENRTIIINGEITSAILKKGIVDEII